MEVVRSGIPRHSVDFGSVSVWLSNEVQCLHAKSLWTCESP